MYVKRITASDDNIDVQNFASLQLAVLIGGSAASTAILFDGQTQAAGTNVGMLAAVIGGSCVVPFDCGEFAFKNGCSVTLAGTGAVLYLYFE